MAADLKFAGVLLLLLPLSRLAHSLSCYECRGERRQKSTDTAYQIVKRSKASEVEDAVNCSREKHHCTGTACVIYDNFNDSTASHHFFTAFCLYHHSMPEQLTHVMAPNGGCWLDEQGRGGRHCVCMKDFCNTPPHTGDKETATSIGAAPITQQLRLLERNPLIDYDYIDDEQHLSEEKSAMPKGTHKGGAALAEIDLDKLEAEQMDDGRSDLAPVEFKDYQQWEAGGKVGSASPPATTFGVVYETSPDQALAAFNYSAAPNATVDVERSGASHQHHYAGYAIQAISAFAVVSFLVHAGAWV